MKIKQRGRRPKAGLHQEHFRTGSLRPRTSLFTFAICFLPFLLWLAAGTLLAGEKTNAEDLLTHAKTLADYDRVLNLDPGLAEAWQGRGVEHFKLGHIKESIADFDKFLELVPQQSPHHWQRGIALYYAGRFADGCRQFELHQTVNPNDVENAVWHFLCMAREAGVEKARTALIPIKGDGRVPMMEVHALFAGQATPEEVLKAASGDGLPVSRRNRQLFHAHLYLGLYFEATGDKTKALEHIKKAAGQYRTDDYMGDVARVHLQLSETTSAPATNSKN